MRRAVIDLGTNTFNLLIADTTTREVLFQTKEGVALGMGGINEQRIGEAAMERAFAALHQFKAHCVHWQVNEIRAIGTSALRDATNAHKLLEKVRAELQITIEIISGLNEADFIYKGVQLTYSFAQPALIMDIGGGSTEFIAANSNGPYLAQSFDIGVSRLFQAFDFSDPYTSADIQKIEAFLASKCGAFFGQHLPTVLIGSSGSFETFYELMEQSVFQSQGQAVEVDTEAFTRMLEQIIYSTQAERDQNPHIIAIRKRMAPLAAIKTRWVLRQAKITQILISPYSLKEGVLFASSC
jgi:exopolyphosphatase / guanosine-5'-triphosphate,3'-diphosphate pyrophosphatase